MYAGYLDLNVPLHWTVDDALPAALCADYISKMQHGQAEVATRNNTRVMWDDPAEAETLLDRVRSHVPERLSGLTLAGANPRLRIYRYGPGERHGAHWDTIVELADGVRSMLTLVFYLNDDFTGGATDFVELGTRVTPRLGRALLFQHRVMHRACEVVTGEKYVLRTDILYRSAP